MCGMNDDPSTYDIEASVDWAALRRMREQREDELRRGIPPMEENQKRVARDMAVEARRKSPFITGYNFR